MRSCSGDRAEAVVGADAEIVILLDLLQHRVRLAAGVDIPGSSKTAEYGSPWRLAAAVIILAAPARRKKSGENALTAMLFGESVAMWAIPCSLQPCITCRWRILFQRLADAQHVAMTKNGSHALTKSVSMRHQC